MWPRRCLAGTVCLAATALLSGCSSSSTSATTTSRPASSSSVTTSSAASTTSSTSTSTTTTSTSAALTACESSHLRIKFDRSSVAVGTIASGFLITNTGTVACTIEGYPGLVLVPASGQVSPVVRRVGQTPRVVTLKAGGEAAFTIEYGDEPVDGQQTCPTIVGLDVTLPQSGGAVSVTARFSPCGAPNLNVSEVLSLALYHQSF
ncbi:MAG: DUF4232 domain-containing protein [Acidimicrobiales bacterium]